MNTQYQNTQDWWRGDKNYQGSSWGHGARQDIAKKFGLDNKASSVAEVGLLSQFQFSEVEIIGQALEKLRNDPEVIKYDNLYASIAKKDPRYGKQYFKLRYRESIEFGGKRASQDIMEQIKNPFNPKYVNTWKVAFNELTWLVRHASVQFEVIIDSKGIIRINHLLNDTFDIRSGKWHTVAYNNVTDILGPAYHDFIGGNDKLKVKASWTTRK